LLVWRVPSARCWVCTRHGRRVRRWGRYGSRVSCEHKRKLDRAWCESEKEEEEHAWKGCARQTRTQSVGFERETSYHIFAAFLGAKCTSHFSMIYCVPGACRSIRIPYGFYLSSPTISVTRLAVNQHTML
jgi:hypothetical protein